MITAKTSTKVLAGLAWLVILSSYSIIFLDTVQLKALSIEDGPVESAGTVLFVMACGLFLAAFFASGRDRRESGHKHARRGWIYLLLALLMFVCAGEEISWGQRIFEWETPQAVAEINRQNETNLHNMNFFHGMNADGTRKSFMLFNMNRLFALFSLALLVGVPVLNRPGSKGAALVRRYRLPLAPWWLAGLFVVHAALVHLLTTPPGQVDPDLFHAINEVKEYNYALMYALLAFLEVRRIR